MPQIHFFFQIRFPLRIAPLLAALKAAALTDTLGTAGPFTVFAPTDEAFKKLPAGTVDSLLKDAKKLKAILTYHVVSGAVMAGVLKADIAASNGVIHVIDTVLMPKLASLAAVA